MEETLYHQTNWLQIQAIVDSNHDMPHSILGPQKTAEGIRINVYMPTAKSVDVLQYKRTGQKRVKMKPIGDNGFYSVLLPLKRIPKYKLIVTYENEVEQEIWDPYSFPVQFSENDANRFSHGIHYSIYNILGAHFCEINGVTGVRFAVWAPNATRVSVVGDFNFWDGRRHPMYKHKDSGVFELFIPELGEGEIYKYELKLPGGMITLKADPYANYAELRPATASRIWNLEKYKWQDSDYLHRRKEASMYKEPMNIYEVHLSTFRKPNENKDNLPWENVLYNYRELAPMLASYVKEMGYTHIEIMPMMEYPFDGSWGYQVTGYYAPTSRYGTPDDFMYFVDYMHSNQIGVILDWVPAHFPKDAHGLAYFDGTHLYECPDPRRGEHPHWGTLIFDYGRPEVSNFLIANALFWLEKYHVDGIRVDAVASMLYLDYGKSNGEWLPNIYGGNENLEAIELLKHMNSIISKRGDGTFMVAEESTSFYRVSHPTEESGLGFHYKWNMGWMNDFLDYMKCDPLFRKYRQGELTFSMVYVYSEHFILVLSHDEVVHGKCSLFNKMPGYDDSKFANLRALYGFMYTHPGKKLLFMGQEFGMRREWNEATEIDWNLLEQEGHRQLRDYVKDLNHFYISHSALYEQDFSPEGFEWIDFMDSDHSIIVFLRKDESGNTLLVVCNFTPNVYPEYRIGVPFAGEYQEIFNSDKECYGGRGNLNSDVIHSIPSPYHERDNSITIVVPPMGISVFQCKPLILKEKDKSEGVVKKAVCATKPRKQTTKGI